MSRDACSLFKYTFLDTIRHVEGHRDDLNDPEDLVPSALPVHQSRRHRAIRVR